MSRSSSCLTFTKILTTLPVNYRFSRPRSLTAIHSRASITRFPWEFRSSERARNCAAAERLARISKGGKKMAEARRMGKSELFSHFAERFEVKRTQAREFFDELTTLA